MKQERIEELKRYLTTESGATPSQTDPCVGSNAALRRSELRFLLEAHDRIAQLTAQVESLKADVHRLSSIGCGSADAKVQG